MNKIYFDMDGTIADFYGVNGWLKDLEAENVRPYAEAKKLVEEEVLLNLVKRGFRLAIISWGAKNATAEFTRRVKATKVEWLKANYPNVEFEEIHVVKYGTPKYRVAHEQNAVLFDDEEPNRRAWRGVALAPEYISNF